MSLQMPRGRRDDTLLATVLKRFYLSADAFKRERAPSQAAALAYKTQGSATIELLTGPPPTAARSASALRWSAVQVFPATLQSQQQAGLLN